MTRVAEWRDSSNYPPAAIISSTPFLFGLEK